VQACKALGKRDIEWFWWILILQQ